MLADLPFDSGSTMKTSLVCKRWGSAAVDESKFNKGNTEDRAAMACSILKNQKKYIGLDRSEIVRLFGKETGYYFSDLFPTYIIFDGSEIKKNTWQLVFKIDSHQKVKKVIVHKNCCDGFPD